MLDPSVRAQYNISYVRSYLRPDISEEKESPIGSILVIFGILWFIGVPVLVGHLDRKYNWKLYQQEYPAWIFIWLGVLAIYGIYMWTNHKKQMFNLKLNASFIQQFTLTDKNTNESHTGYAFVEGYDLLSMGTASVGAMIEDFRVKSVRAQQIENIRVSAAKEKKTKDNAKQISALIHEEEFQQKTANSIIRNEAFPEGMKYQFFDKCRPFKKKYNGRYYFIPGNRGVEMQIIVPRDCGFDEYIKEQNK